MNLRACAVALASITLMAPTVAFGARLRSRESGSGSSGPLSAAPALPVPQLPAAPVVARPIELLRNAGATIVAWIDSNDVRRSPAAPSQRAHEGWLATEAQEILDGVTIYRFEERTGGTGPAPTVALRPGFSNGPAASLFVRF